MRMGTVCTSFSQGVVIGLTIFLPLYYEVVHKFTASDSGLALIPIVVMSTPGSILAGRAMMFLNHYKRVPIVGLSCSIAALSRSEEHTSELQSPCNLVCRLLLEKKKNYVS